MDKFCLMPFLATRVGRNKRYFVCCNFDFSTTPEYYVHTHTSDQWINSEFMQSLRNQFVNGEEPVGCKKCWDEENNGVQSLRKSKEQELKFFKKKLNFSTTKFVDIDLTMSAICNLKCMMCHEDSSSTLLKENIELKLTKKRKPLMVLNDNIHNIFNLITEDTKTINLTGGEPFYTKEIELLIDSIPLEIKKNITFLITTNGTIINRQVLQKLKDFKLVKFVVSLDASEKLYNYMRYPADWDEVRKNAIFLKDNENFNVSINTVIQNLNVGNLYDICKWCVDNNFYHFLSVLKNPEVFDYKNLMDNDRSDAIENLKKCLTIKNLKKENITTIKGLIKNLELSKSNLNSWKEFLKEVEPRDNYRRTSWKSFLLGK